jgi:hypothetical protein
MQTQADRTKDLADRMKEQADLTKTIADQAIVQANAAKSSSDTAISALNIANRPWIGIAEWPILTMFNITAQSADRASIAYSMTYPIRNFGPSPALHINGEITPDFLEFYPDDPFSVTQSIDRGLIENACHGAEQYTTRRKVTGVKVRNGKKESHEVYYADPTGPTIFPGQTQAMESGSGTINNIKTIANLPYIYFFGCVAYTDQFSQRIHHTGFCYYAPSTTDAVGKPLRLCGVEAYAD